MSAYTRAGVLKRGLLLFWALWISIVVLMNAGDILRAGAYLPHDWPAASGNLQAIEKVTKIYGTPRWLDVVLLGGVTVWETVCSLLFWRAFAQYCAAHRNRLQSVYLAFLALLALFATFILTDEVCHAYRYEGDHRGIAILLLASLLSLHLLPDKIGT